MKILRIRLKNLNSLKGEHCVDLTAEPLASAGLFAITGPTGAGKTTLLDAVTLALYGKAARYGSESNPEHVMSRHCGECSAEVEFEVPAGVFRSVWERRRARGKADGALQQPKRYIYDTAGTALTQQIREAEEKIEELLGLNYDRFLRSVLLAQGEFARFLKANANERAELLESLTGTEIYSRLGARAHEEANRRENDLRGKEAGMGQIQILPEEDRMAMVQSIEQGDREYQTLGKEMEEGAGMLQKIGHLEEARRKERKATEDKVLIETERKAATADLERLRCHRLTVPFSDALVRFDTIEATAKLATTRREGAEKKHETAKQALLKANWILRAAVTAALETERKKAELAAAIALKETKAANEAGAWLDEHQPDARLADQLGDLVAAIGELKSSRTSLAREWSDWTAVASQILTTAAQALPVNLEATKDLELEAALDEFLGQAGKRKKTLEAEVEDAKQQQALRKDHLEKAKLIAKLEAHRHNLKQDEPCPLCGALDHPYAESAVPNAEMTTLESEVKKAGDKHQDCLAATRTFSEKVQDLTTDRGNLLTSFRVCHEQLKALAALLKPLAEQVPSPGSENALRTQIQERGRLFSLHLKTQNDASQRKVEAEREAATRKEEAAKLEHKVRTLKPLSADIDVESLAVGGLPSVSVADGTYSSYERQEGITGNEALGRIKDEKSALDDLGKLRGPLEISVTATEFKKLETLRQARLAADAAGKLEALDTGLKNRTTAATALLNQACEDIMKLIGQQVLEAEAAESFKARQNQLRRDGEKSLSELTTRRNQIKRDDENRKLRHEKEKELEEDRGSLVVWKRLRELIGSQDGSKFRRYAQAISLDILMRHANRHLAKLSDRYRICRDEVEALNLQIEDLHQAGVRRPMASLSGGESFLASLALALGLSDIAGRTVRIDSLFIDEGFGSLDPETLEVAIAALESLRQDHKTVGIISHVGLLKERISTQIVVDKLAGGVSRIRVVSGDASL